MLRLILLRHAKAERSHSSGRDHERSLAPRGRDDAPRIGAYLERHGLVPDRAIVSTAARTRETWALVSEAFRRAPPAEFDDRIYEAAPRNILAAVHGCGPDVHTLMVVGHNPGLHELAIDLVASGDLDARQRLNEGFPTAALAVIDFSLEAWPKLHSGCGRLDRFIVPRALAAATD